MVKKKNKLVLEGNVFMALILGSISKSDLKIIDTEKNVDKLDTILNFNSSVH